MNNLDTIFAEAKKASFELSTASTKQKNDILSAVAKAISEDMKTILLANETDIKNAIQYNEDARNYLITLTDCYDPTNYITIDLEWQETRRYYNFRANPAGEMAHGLRPVKAADADATSINIGDSYYTQLAI